MISRVLLPLLLFSWCPLVTAMWPFDGPATTTLPPLSYGDTDWTLRMKLGMQCLGWDAVLGAIKRDYCRAGSSQLWRFNRTIQSFAGHRMCLSMERPSFVGGNCSYWNGSNMVNAMPVVFRACDETDANQIFHRDGNLIVSKKCDDLCLSYNNRLGIFSLSPCGESHVSENLNLTNVSASWATLIAKDHPEIRVDSIINAVSAEYSSFTVLADFQSEHEYVLAVVAMMAILAVASATLANSVNPRTSQRLVRRDDERGSWSLIPTEDPQLTP